MIKNIFTILCLVASLSNGFCSDGNQIKKKSPRGSFSIVVISDTQAYLGRGTKRQPDSKDEVSNPIFESQSNWGTGKYKTAINCICKPCRRCC